VATDRTTTPGAVPAIPPTALALRPREAAKALGISERMLWSLTAPRGTIQSVRVGSCVLYPVTGLQAWLDQQAQATSEGGAA
jgi:predicted DNA-binding transcriptional regulator AlpA